jgi:heme A synthase
MFLLPVRWVLVLILLIRAARTKPFRWLPRAPGLQATALVVIQVVLGLASFLGWWAVWWDTSKVAERIVGFFFCSFLPAVVVAFLVWRSAPQKTVYMGNG